MFGLASGYYQSYLQSIEVSIILVGLDGAGKTTFLERLKVTEFKGVSSCKISSTRVSGEQKVGNSYHLSQENLNETNGKDSKSRSENSDLTLNIPTDSQKIGIDTNSDQVFEIESNGGNIEFKQSQENVNIKHDSSRDRNSSNSFSGNACCSVDDHEILNSNKTKASKIYKQYDLKKGKTMLPERLIRPTLGMNLGKFEACDAIVRVMDLSGATSMRTLWERYYAGTNGVIFVIGVSPQMTMAKLMEARAFYRCMRDDESLNGVPILIFLNKIGELCEDSSSFRNGMVNKNKDNVSSCISNMSLGDIAELFLSAPRGAPTDSVSNNFEVNCNSEVDPAICVGSALTGEGVRSAIEWLIPKSRYYKEQQIDSGN
mmetsp:Transcript_6717/g.9683  ORF Transcript_6717/g.9683 Transcript_6717/m.9683 type:complete len:373 (-) Transcript_6717:191-1309(-)|eukprot:CAMPEP_0184866922 /NCGR_PEP_ID=MMETSP0580-20130426/24264_1 /TAXON_ID=1118495 /ORGANISM="Dactyliosolen fragilissimus" /LENGTH=372 /DNA_ID=CAMNT_0027366865 /DNA_START=95 /DNA_END=1213 /DNA_ORIENTATION=+